MLCCDTIQSHRLSTDTQGTEESLCVTEISIERFSYDLEMKTREQNRNNKRMEIERFDWFIERIQTRVAFCWLSERSGEKTSCPRTF